MTLENEVELYKTDTVLNDEKLKAAYALNLCTVSVSQIIEYNDLMVLEQEYEAILNNLNLENIPKDESLLNILKQLLDTITFFRIQSGDKKLIERQYQMKMKNAIWSAVPNFGLIVAGGNPMTMAVSLATQVGIGYMNYRKSKAENLLEHDEKTWQLQRAAIEQLNGLRRELFDTAWRLADAYKFPDEYRLTEKQIAQYNGILLDSDVIRRYERLDAIKSKFVAYVPFWYHLGNAAVLASYDNRLPETSKKQFIQLGRKYFEYFHELNVKRLLREDPIASTCALELCDLLDPYIEREKIEALIDTAVKASGDSLDVLQLCAFAYLRIQQVEKAEQLLRILVNERYNPITNAQFLSQIYVSNFVLKIEPQLMNDKYALLETKIASDYLFPMIRDGIYDFELLKSNFLLKQKEITSKKYKFVINEFIKKYTIQFNQLFPKPDLQKTYQSDFYLDSDGSRLNRMNEIDRALANKAVRRRYMERFEPDEVIYNFFEIINEQFELITRGFDSDEKEFLHLRLVSEIIKTKSYFDSLMVIKQKQYLGDEDIEIIFGTTFKELMYDYFKGVYGYFEKRISNCQKLSELSEVEIELDQLCLLLKIRNIDEVVFNLGELKVEKNYPNYISTKIIGIDYQNVEQQNQNKRRMKDIILKASPSIINDDKYQFIMEDSIEFANYFDGSKAAELYSWKRNVFAILVGKEHSDFDLILTQRGLITFKKSQSPKMAFYEWISLAEDTLLMDVINLELLDPNDHMELNNIAMAKERMFFKKSTKIKFKNKSVDSVELNKVIKLISQEGYSRKSSNNKKVGELKEPADFYDFLN